MIVVAYVASRPSPALSIVAICNLPAGSPVVAEGYILPITNYSQFAVPAESDTCQNNICFLSLFSQPAGVGNRLSLELPTTGQSYPFVGIHGELNLPLTIPIKNQPTCLSVGTKFRVSGTLAKTADHACLIQQVQSLEVVDNASAFCGP